MIPTRSLRRPRVVIVGCGDVGSRMVPLLSRRFKLFALNRQAPSADSTRRLRDAGGVPVSGDLDARNTLQRIGALAASAAGVFHFAPPPAVSNTDLRTRAFIAAVATQSARAQAAQSASRKQRAISGRLRLSRPLSRGLSPVRRFPNGLTSAQSAAQSIAMGASARKIADIVTDAGARQRYLREHPRQNVRQPAHRRSSHASSPALREFPRLLRPSPPPPLRAWRRRPQAADGRAHSDALRIVYASTTGVYGDCAGALIDETRLVNPANARAIRRVSAERQLRAAGARGACRPVILRIPGIYAADRLPDARLRKGTPALRVEDDVFTSHIHADDLAAIAVRAWHKGRPQRLYHASDDSRMKMGDYFERVADALKLPHPRRISREQAERELEPVMLSFMRESRRLDNRRLSAELQYRLRYPSVDAFLAILTGR